MVPRSASTAQTRRSLPGRCSCSSGPRKPTSWLSFPKARRGNSAGAACCIRSSAPKDPERIAPEWWRRDAKTALERDYYAVEDENGWRFWLYRDGHYGEGATPRWFLQACSHEEVRMTRFAELAAATNFSFLRGASHAQEIVLQAQELGLAAIGIADRNTLAGVVRACGR